MEENFDQPFSPPASDIDALEMIAASLVAILIHEHGTVKVPSIAFTEAVKLVRAGFVPVMIEKWRRQTDIAIYGTQATQHVVAEAVRRRMFPIFPRQIKDGSVPGTPLYRSSDPEGERLFEPPSLPGRG